MYRPPPNFASESFFTMSNRRSLLCFLTALLASAMCLPARAQKLERVINYPTVNLRDTVEMTIHYYSDPDSLQVGSLKVDVRPFRIIRGPLQSTNSASSLEGDVWKHSHRLSLTYYLRADSAGSFILPPVVMKTKDGREQRTMPLTLEVSDSPVAKKRPKQELVWGMAEHSLDVQDPFAGGSMMITRAERTRNALFATGEPFALVTGWLHRPDSFPDDVALAMLAEVNDYVQSQEGAELLSNELSATGPRLYYTLKDTAGIKNTLDSIFRKAPAAAHAAVVIVPPKQWDEYADRKYFTAAGSVWRVLHILLEDPSIGAYKRSGACTAEMRCAFKELKDMDAFSAKMVRMGYKTAGGSRKPGSTGLYEVTITGNSRMTLQALYDTVIKVSDELCLPGYKGASLMRVGIRPER